MNHTIWDGDVKEEVISLCCWIQICVSIVWWLWSGFSLTCSSSLSFSLRFLFVLIWSGNFFFLSVNHHSSFMSRSFSDQSEIIDFAGQQWSLNPREVSQRFLTTWLILGTWCYVHFRSWIGVLPQNLALAPITSESGCKPNQLLLAYILEKEMQEFGF